jgi:hypothetical protein
MLHTTVLVVLQHKGRLGYRTEGSDAGVECGGVECAGCVSEWGAGCFRAFLDLDAVCLPQQYMKFHLCFDFSHCNDHGQHHTDG